MIYGPRNQMEGGMIFGFQVPPDPFGLCGLNSGWSVVLNHVPKVWRVLIRRNLTDNYCRQWLTVHESRNHPLMYDPLYKLYTLSHRISTPFFLQKTEYFQSEQSSFKEGCVFLMVVISIPSQAEFGPDDNKTHPTLEHI